MIREDQTPLRIAVLISGGGTNLQAMIDRAGQALLRAKIVVVVSDRPDVYGLVRAAQAGIPTRVVDYKSILQSSPARSDTESFPVDPEEIDRAQKILRMPDPKVRLERLRRLMTAEQQLIQVLEPFSPDLICLAGFMRLVSPYFIRHFNRGGTWRILNIHPALLPAFPGQHGYEDTFQYGCRWGGVTVHFVDEGEDTGPIIAQAVYPLWPQDTIESVRQRGLSLEYEIYAQCINWLAADQVEIQDSSPRPTVRIKDSGYAGILERWVQTALLK